VVLIIFTIRMQRLRAVRIFVSFVVGKENCNRWTPVVLTPDNSKININYFAKVNEVCEGDRYLLVSATYRSHPRTCEVVTRSEIQVCSTPRLWWFTLMVYDVLGAARVPQLEALKM
jgi:hypothetical protein